MQHSLSTVDFLWSCESSLVKSGSAQLRALHFSLVSSGLFFLFFSLVQDYKYSKIYFKKMVNLANYSSSLFNLDLFFRT